MEIKLNCWRKIYNFEIIFLSLRAKSFQNTCQEVTAFQCFSLMSRFILPSSGSNGWNLWLTNLGMWHLRNTGILFPFLALCYRDEYISHILTNNYERILKIRILLWIKKSACSPLIIITWHWASTKDFCLRDIQTVPQSPEKWHTFFSGEKWLADCSQCNGS